MCFFDVYKKARKTFKQERINVKNLQLTIIHTLVNEDEPSWSWEIAIDFLEEIFRHEIVQNKMWNVNLVWFTSY